MYSRSKRKITDIRFLSCNNVQKVVRKVVLTCFSHYSGNKNNYMPLTFRRERTEEKSFSMHSLYDLLVNILHQVMVTGTSN